eukprot:gene30194-37365_t
MTIDTYDGTGVRPPHWNLGPVIEQLRISREATHNIRHQGRVRELPSREALTTIVNGLSAVLFPTHYGRPNLTDESIDYFVGDTLNTTLNRLTEQVRRGLQFREQSNHSSEDALTEQANNITREFAAGLPGIRALLVSDVQAAFAGDPAATSVAEIMLCYPGTIAILHYRLAHLLHQLGAPFIARLICDIAHSKTGVDIHPAAQIGASWRRTRSTGARDRLTPHHTASTSSGAMMARGASVRSARLRAMPRRAAMFCATWMTCERVCIENTR